MGVEFGNLTFKKRHLLFLACDDGEPDLRARDHHAGIRLRPRGPVASAPASTLTGILNGVDELGFSRDPSLPAAFSSGNLKGAVNTAQARGRSDWACRAGHCLPSSRGSSTRRASAAIRAAEASKGRAASVTGRSALEQAMLDLASATGQGRRPHRLQGRGALPVSGSDFLLMPSRFGRAGSPKCMRNAMGPFRRLPHRRPCRHHRGWRNGFSVPGDDAVGTDGRGDAASAPTPRARHCRHREGDRPSNWLHSSRRYNHVYEGLLASR